MLYNKKVHWSGKFWDQIQQEKSLNHYIAIVMFPPFYFDIWWIEGNLIACDYEVFLFWYNSVHTY